MQDLLQRWADWKQEPEKLSLLGIPIVFDSMVPEGQIFFMTQATVMTLPMKKKARNKKRCDWGEK